MVERSKRIELRVTADELRQIHERMQEAGISSLTAYMIRMALHGYVIVMDLSDLKEVPISSSTGCMSTSASSMIL